MLAREAAPVPGKLAFPVALEMGPSDMREASPADDRPPTNLIAVSSIIVPGRREAVRSQSPNSPPTQDMYNLAKTDGSEGVLEYGHGGMGAKEITATLSRHAPAGFAQGARHRQT